MRRRLLVLFVTSVAFAYRKRRLDRADQLHPVPARQP